MSELTDEQIEEILRQKRKESARRRYMLNREVYKRRANIRYALQREEICAKFRERYANDPAFRQRRLELCRHG